MKLLKPLKLNSKDTIGIVSPSLPILSTFRTDYENGKKNILDLGFSIVEGKTTKLNRWWSGGTLKEQADDINQMFSDNNISAIIASSGGYSSIGVLEHLDYEMIIKNPKPFIGFSDMTAYHLALFSKTGLVGFHMDEVSSGIGQNWQKVDVSTKSYVSELFTQALTSTVPIGKIRPLRERKTWKRGRAQGRLIGGNINSISRQIGSNYFPDLSSFDGAILFWEAVGLHRYEISQMLYQLKYHGIFDKIAGMLIGTITATQPSRDKEIDEPTFKDFITELLLPYDFPVLAGMDFGHYTVNIPMPIGINAAMDATNQTFELLEAAVV